MEYIVICDLNFKEVTPMLHSNGTMRCLVFMQDLLLIGSFCPKILDRRWGPTKAICCSMNVDGVGMVLADGGDTSTLYVIIEVV